MSLEREIVVFCVCVAVALVVRAAMVRGRRWRLLVPAVGLVLLAVYELGMDRWEKTVHAAIRLDLMVEIPLVGVFVIWGVLALVFSGKRGEKADGGEG
jgi:uncharacterized membrane protein